MCNYKKFKPCKRMCVFLPKRHSFVSSLKTAKDRASGVSFPTRDMPAPVLLCPLPTFAYTAMNCPTHRLCG